SFVGLLGFIIYAAMFGITLFAGYGMDLLGRKKMWMWCLCGAAAFTGLTYFVQNYWQLAVVRALASGFAISELAISITLVNSRCRRIGAACFIQWCKEAGLWASSLRQVRICCCGVSVGGWRSCSG